MRGFTELILTIALTIATIAAPVLAQDQPSEKHVAEINAETKARYPQGLSESPPCQRARGQKRPVVRYREPNLAALEKDLPALMQNSDEVVLVGLDLAVAKIPSPSEEDVISYIDIRVLRSWKGLHKVGDLLTIGFPQGDLICRSDPFELAWTTIGPGPRFVFYTRNPAYGPAGPFVMFLRYNGTSEIEGLRLTGGEGIQGMFDVRPVDDTDQLTDPHAAAFSCAAASTGGSACYGYANRSRGPDSCRNPRIDAENIENCNAALARAQEPMVAYGVNQDPVREKYNGMSITSFLEQITSLAGAGNSADDLVSK